MSINIETNKKYDKEIELARNFLNYINIILIIFFHLLVYYCR